MTEIVQVFHGVHIDLYTTVSQKIGEFLIASSALVSGNVKAYHTIQQMFFQRIHQRCILLCPFHNRKPPQ